MASLRKPLDDETGLYYYGARYYNPTIGRFITADPTIQRPGDPQDLNRYSYCRNNPVNLVDPTGYSWWSKFWKSLVGGLIGAVVGILSGQPWLGFSAYNAFMGVMNGGNIGAALAGAVVGYFGGGMIGDAFGVFWGTLGAGALGGAAGAAIGGGDIGLAALSGLGGGLAGYGVGALIGFAGLGTIIGGGVGAEIAGGDFGEGALGGLAYNIGFTVGSTFAVGLTPVEQSNPESGDQVFFAGERIGKGGSSLKGWFFSAAMAILDPGPFNHTGISLGGNRIADSHPEGGGRSGPNTRILKGEGQFKAYEGEKVAVVKHKQALGVAAEVIANKQHRAGVTFGGGPFGGGQKTSYCSQFTGHAYKTSGETGVYGYGPNTQYWYTKK